MADFSQLTQDALGLPVEQRLLLAQRLWASLQPESDDVETNEVQEAVDEALRRAADLDSGRVQAIPHEQVMADARKSIRCA
ncbi:MAG: addiction module protein [Planctomycetia bacterium]|nr:addiction module protein [Planctomycetia bacterium]